MGVVLCICGGRMWGQMGYEGRHDRCSCVIRMQMVILLHGGLGRPVCVDVDSLGGACS